ncbi:hypothetical protein AGABI2DRAFT_75380 [Agaricus bisporus var. bisporus H97]|uniref:hypothetical protein n=1 Tax=Agaricus bisporus var. bisporus (strain H97 / ATCC MYA-4626 / FGSC 10389) TaxID=936046 RepID=UPI00029F5E47|nr:hypothetical protein AGABI2DRAFT_75380 [Agaricus bisporus var. bisporus H97]EKV44096.1 hypothetical protein AGABI2DRAFT_75380 [Agaricus bisporus var. bisporus H97]
MNPFGELNSQTTAQYLRTLPAIRERCLALYDLATQDKLLYFDYHPEKEADVVDFCLDIIKRDYNSDPNNIQPHGRWRHLDAGLPRIQPLLTTWSHLQIDIKEQSRRLIDLFLISVLLDAGAGNTWKYIEPGTNKTFNRSEGLGVASAHMFQSGFFSGVEGEPSAGLEKITVERTKEAMQVTSSNPMTGLEGRTSLLSNLSKALTSNPEFFGTEGRPGNLIDFLETQALPTTSNKKTIPLAALWTALLDGLNPIWPSRISLANIPLGDVWPSPTLAQSVSTTSQNRGTQESDILIPFHKLTQWMTYSLVEVFEKVLGWDVQGLDDMTGLPEYRNGGLLVDLGVLVLKPDMLPVNSESGLPTASAEHPAIVEWRAMTVIELDRIADRVRERLGLGKEELSLAQVLEGATWKGGREIAKMKRPGTGGPPIEIESDGTVF